MNKKIVSWIRYNSTLSRKLRPSIRSTAKITRRYYCQKQTQYQPSLHARSSQSLHDMLTIRDAVRERRVYTTATASAYGNMSSSFSDIEVKAEIDKLVDALDNDRKSVPKIWSLYDQLKIKRMLQYIPYESWLKLLRTCQVKPPSLSIKRIERSRVFRASNLSDPNSFIQNQRDSLFPLLRNKGSIESDFGKEFIGPESYMWTRHMAKRRALMILGDMWRCTGSADGSSIDDNKSDSKTNSDMYITAEDSIRSLWRPTAHHYSIVFDAISNEPTSKVEDLFALHQDMKLHSVKENIVTFNTLLNGVCKLGAWMHFRLLDEQLRDRDEWGITKMDATTWGTLIQGYMECCDWKEVDQCVTQVTRLCHNWAKNHRETENENSNSSDSVNEIEPTVGLWAIIVNSYARQDKVAEMLASRRVMESLGITPNEYVFAPIFAALHRMRRRLARQGKDTWPAMDFAVKELRAMHSHGIPLNIIMLTNAAMILKTANPYDKENHIDDNYGDLQQQKMVASRIGTKIKKELESMLQKARDPMVYVSLLNICANECDIGEARMIWITLTSEARFSRDANGSPLLTSMTLAAYLHALIKGKRYDEAINTFRNISLIYRKTNTLHKSRSVSTYLRLQTTGADSYEAAIKALALSDKHSQAIILIRKMISNGVQPTVYILRYLLLAPDPSYNSDGRWGKKKRYTRRWSLPLSLAQDAWDLVVNKRKEMWIGGKGKSLLADYEGAIDVSHDNISEMPVIVNDIASQFIRIASYARNIRFGEEVFEALESERQFYGMNGYNELGTDEYINPAPDIQESVEPESSTIDRRFPNHLQCIANIKTYTALISLYGNCIRLDKVSRTWSKMIAAGIEPNIKTYTSLMVALHRSSLMKRWKRTMVYSELLKKNVNITSVTNISNPLDEILNNPQHRYYKLFGGGKSDNEWWGSTENDKTIYRIEDSLVPDIKSLEINSSHPNNSQEASAQAGVHDASNSSENINDKSRLFTDNIVKEPKLVDMSQDFDIPLGTLLLRYHALRIKDTIRDISNVGGDDASYINIMIAQNTNTDVERATRVCLAAENSGLTLDIRFHAALVDFFETCGDFSAADLVRDRMEKLYNSS